MSVVPTSEQVAAQLRALRAALDGTGDPVEFTADGEIVFRPEARDPARGGHPDAVAVVRTSGSTGTPKQTVLTAANLRASAEATAQVIGSGGQWLLAVGTQFVAGLAVLSRSILADTEPVVLGQGSFSAESFCSAAARLDDSMPHFVSLVPTQLARLLEDDSAATRQALQGFTGILVGGAAIPTPLVEQSRALGLKLYLTYGSSETSGGCVYNGVPLPGVTVDTVPYATAGTSVGDTAATIDRLRITGPMVAAGYLDNPELTAEHFSQPAPDASPPVRSYLTDDEGTITVTDNESNPEISVTGRIDDVIITGGVKVSAGAVQKVLLEHPAVSDAFVAGLPDPEWGQRIFAVLVLAESFAAVDPPAMLEGRIAELSRLIRDRLGAAAVPKNWYTRDELPQLPNGKTDRTALIEWAQQQP